MKEKISVRHIISNFNRSDAHRHMIPMGLVAGWPAISMVGRAPAITIPYFSRKPDHGRVALYPIFCSVTLAIHHPERILDFTIYSGRKGWEDVDYGKPCGYFKHKALEDVTTREQYQQLQAQVFDCYDDMVAAVLKREPFARQQEMTRLLTKMMEPDLFPQYHRINPKFYGAFCKLEENAK